MISEFSNDFLLYFHHTLGQADNVFIRDSDTPILCGQLTLIHVPKILLKQSNEFFNVGVVGKRFSDVFDLNAGIFNVGGGDKNNCITFLPLGCQVNKITFWGFPNAMKFGFDQDAFPDVDAPSKLLFSAVCRNMLWNDCETFIEWLSGNRSQWDYDGFMV